MKISKYLFLVLGIIYFIDFIMLFFYKGNTHEFFLWEVNIWLYRAFKLLLGSIFIIIFFERHNARFDKPNL